MQPVLMEKSLAEMVQNLTPKRKNMVVTCEDAVFEQILVILGRAGQVSDERKPTIKIDLEASHFFEGFKALEDGKHVALFLPRFWIAPMENNNDRGWEVERFRQGDTFYDDMREIMEVAPVEVEVSVEETTLSAVGGQNTQAYSGKTWVLKR